MLAILRDAAGTLTDEEVAVGVRAATDSAALGFERASAVVARVEMLVTHGLPLDHVDPNLERIRCGRRGRRQRGVHRRRASRAAHRRGRRRRLRADRARWPPSATPTVEVLPAPDARNRANCGRRVGRVSDQAPAGAGQAVRAASTTSLASACTSARWSGPRNDSA